MAAPHQSLAEVHFIISEDQPAGSTCAAESHVSGPPPGVPISVPVFAAASQHEFASQSNIRLHTQDAVSRRVGPVGTASCQAQAPGGLETAIFPYANEGTDPGNEARRESRNSCKLPCAAEGSVSFPPDNDRPCEGGCDPRKLLQLGTVHPVDIERVAPQRDQQRDVLRIDVGRFPVDQCIDRVVEILGLPLFGQVHHRRRRKRRGDQRPPGWFHEQTHFNRTPW